MIGAGTGGLIGKLLEHGYTDIDAVDISQCALEQLRSHLGQHASSVRFSRADVRSVVFDTEVDVWHDRAVFHFLLGDSDQAEYAARAAAAVRPGGHLVIGTFSAQGPEQCSGLPVYRHTRASLSSVFAPYFHVLDAMECDHITPWGAHQQFVHLLMQRCES